MFTTTRKSAYRKQNKALIEYAILLKFQKPDGNGVYTGGTLSYTFF